MADSTEAETQTPSKQEEILSELSALAPTVEVRDCLRLYKVENNTKSLKSEFNKCNKDTLVATLAYLHVPNQNKYTKPACVNNLVCRVQNLFPDICTICGELYHLTRLEEPLLSCEMCGQGSHNSCVLELLNVQENEGITAKEVMAKINPSKMPGFHYLCGPCSEETIPEKDAGMLRRTACTIKSDSTEPKEVFDTNGEQIVAPTDSTPIQNKENEEEKAERATEGSTEMIPVNNNKSEEKINEPAGEGLTTSIPNVTRKKQEENKTTEKNEGVNEKKSKTVCDFYKKGTCRHGASGKGCHFEHPKPCTKLMRHGNKGPNGCTLGKDKCGFFHPKMCPSSLQKGTCFNKECKLRHISGTRHNIEEAERTSPSTPRGDNSKIHQNSFLEILNSFKQEVLAELDKKIAKVQVVQQPTIPASVASPTVSQTPYWQPVNQIMTQAPNWQQVTQPGMPAPTQAPNWQTAPPMGWNPTPQYQMMLGPVPGQMVPTLYQC